MRKRIRNLVILALLIMAGVFVGSAILSSSIAAKQLTISLSSFTSDLTIKATIAILGICLLAFLATRKRNLAAEVTAAANLENSRWLTKPEIRRCFRTATYTTLSDVVDGLPLHAEETKNAKDIRIHLAKPSHAIVIGTTGSGKTTCYINPTIQILSSSKTKPSLVITDPKGELHALHAASLVAKGYKVAVLNLREPYKSVRWNPLAPIYDKIDRAVNLAVEPRRGKYYCEDTEYQDYAEAEKAVKILAQQLWDEAYSDLDDLTMALCPTTSEKDSMWSEGARNLILAFLLGMLEDIEELLIDKDQFCFYNLYRNMSDYFNGNFVKLKEFFAIRKPTAKSIGLAAQVLETAEVTAKGYLTNVFNALKIFADTSICHLTSANEIDFKSFDEQATAFFLVIPDERDNRNKLATMVITQIYKDLIAKANDNHANGQTTDYALKRNVYCLLDEFGNLPKLSKLETVITASRSRKLFYVMVLQSYSQLHNLYGKDVAETVIGNANLQLFIGTTDEATTKAFSARCGNYVVSSKGMSSGKEIGENYNTQQRPLIYPSELMTLNNEENVGNIISTAFGYYPIKAKFTPSYKTSVYTFPVLSDKIMQSPELPELFDEDSIHYDIALRTKMLMEFEVERDQIAKGISEAEASPEKKRVVVGLEFLEKIQSGLRHKSKEEILDILSQQLEAARSAKNHIMISMIVSARLRTEEHFKKVGK